LGFAEIGNRTAYFNLGRMFVFGHGVPIDLLEAYKWFKLADLAGLPQAKSGLNRVGRVMTSADVIEGTRRVERWYDQHPRTRRK
jgi:TPR repeat protein